MSPTTPQTGDTGAAARFDDDVALVVSASDQLATTLRALDGDDLAAPSLCPGWTRSHVLAHVARNADALANLLTWAATGVEIPAYASPEDREAGIQAGAGLSIADHEADLEASGERFLARCAELPPDRLDVEVAFPSGRVVKAGEVPWLRVREVVLHHVDLDAGFGLDHVHDDVVARLLDDSVALLEARGGTELAALEVDGVGRLERDGAPGVRVSGAARPVLAWLTGRSDGSGLAVEGGLLPTLPPWP